MQLKPVNFDRCPFQVTLSPAAPPGSVWSGDSARNIRVEIRAGFGQPGGVGDQTAADQQLLALGELGELVREHHRLALGDRDPGAEAGRLHLGRRLGGVAGTEADHPDPGHVLDHLRHLLVLADEEHVARRGVPVPGADHEVDV